MASHSATTVQGRMDCAKTGSIVVPFDVKHPDPLDTTVPLAKYTDCQEIGLLRMVSKRITAPPTSSARRQPRDCAHAL